MHHGMLRSLIRDKGHGVPWVRGHIGIAGSGKADKRAEYESILGEISDS